MAGVVEYAAVVVLLLLSGLFSGLNLGLMSSDKVGLELTVRTGTPREARWARAILPIRKTGNFLLCTLLLGNTAVNAMLAIFLGDMTGGIVGGIASTLGIVIVGEIIPQSICARYGLAVGYYTRAIVVLFMVAMSPLAYPTAKLLDCVLGEELSQVFSAFQLRHLVHLNSESGGHGGQLSNFEAKLLMGALKLEERRVREAVTKFDEIPCVSLSTPLDAQLMHKLFHSPHLCVPVLEVAPLDSENRGEEARDHNVIDFLNVKDVIFYGSMLQADLVVGDILTWYDTSCILYLSADELMHQAYQKFEQTHRHYAVVLDDGHPIGFVSQEDLMRGWALRHQHRDDDAARFGVKTQRVNNAVRSLALTWKQRARESGAGLPRSGTADTDSTAATDDPAGSIDITRISPECRTQLASLLPFGSSTEALVQKKTLFTIYLLLVRQAEAFRPSAIKAERASKLLSLPRVHFLEAEGAEIVSQGMVQECTIIFEGTVKVHGEDAIDSVAAPIRIFNDDALLSEDARSTVKVAATSHCSVLRISRLDYQACCRGSMDVEMEPPWAPAASMNSSEFVLPNCVT